MRNNCPVEDDECYKFVQWLDYHRFLFSHIKNENKSGNPILGAKYKRLGVRKGCPDYLIFISPVDSFNKKPLILFIEMKRQKGSTTKKEQLEWIYELNTVENVAAFICKGADEAIDTVKKHLLYAD